MISSLCLPRKLRGGVLCSPLCPQGPYGRSTQLITPFRWTQPLLRVQDCWTKQLLTARAEGVLKVYWSVLACCLPPGSKRPCFSFCLALYCCFQSFPTLVEIPGLFGATEAFRKVRLYKTIRWPRGHSTLPRDLR